MIMSNRELAERIAAKVEQMIKNEIPLPSCPQLREKAEWDRQEVKRIAMAKLLPASVGPTEIK